MTNDSLDNDMVADALKFEVIDDLPAVTADAIKLVTNDGEDIQYVHADHLGSPQKMTDKDRNVVWDAAYLPFGEEHSLTGSAANDNRFPGQRFEAETGLHYNYFRDYDPSTGRYLQSDPIGLAGGINTYGYVSGNPVNAYDPDGLKSSKLAMRKAKAFMDLAPKIYEQCKVLLDDLIKSFSKVKSKPEVVEDVLKTVKRKNGKLIHPDEMWSKNAPHQVAPGNKSMAHEKYNPKTGKTEKSIVEYDDYGRQTKRTDYTDHGYSNTSKPKEYHSDPHTHKYEYGPGYGAKGKETRTNQ